MAIPPRPPVGQFEGGAVFTDGAYAPLSEGKVSLFDWGFTRSDATYDVASTWNGAFFRLDAHMDRFFASLQTLRLQIPYTRDELRQILHGCVRTAGLKEAYVAMVCTRGVPPRGARDPRLATESLLCLRRCPMCGSRRRTSSSRGSICTSASASASGPNRSTRASRTTTGSTWCSRCSTPTSAATTPAAWSTRKATSPRARASTCSWCKAAWCTPPTAACSKASRAAPRSSCASGWTSRCASRRCRADAVRNADEVFLTSTGGGILPIAKIDGRPVKQFPGPLTTRLRDAYWAMREEPAYRDPVDYRE